MIIDAGCIWLSSTDLLGPPCCDPEPAGAAARLGSEVHALIHRTIRRLGLPPASPEALEQLALWQRDYVMPPDERIICSESDAAPAAVRVQRVYPGDTELRANIRVKLRERCVECPDCRWFGVLVTEAQDDRCPMCAGSGYLDIGIQSSGDLTYHSDDWRGICSDDWKDGRNQDEDRWLKQSGIEALLSHACAPGYEWYEATAVWVRYHCTRWAHRYPASAIPSLREWWADQAQAWFAARKADTRTLAPFCAPDAAGEGGCKRRLECPAYQAAFAPFDAETLKAENMVEADALEDRLSAIGRAVEAGKKRLKNWRLTRAAMCPVEAGRYYFEKVTEVAAETKPRAGYTKRKLTWRPATEDEISRFAPNRGCPDGLEALPSLASGLEQAPALVAPETAETGKSDAGGLDSVSQPPAEGAPQCSPTCEMCEAFPNGEDRVSLPIQPSDPAALPFAEPERKRAPRRKPVQCLASECAHMARPVSGGQYECPDHGRFVVETGQPPISVVLVKNGAEVARGEIDREPKD